MTLAMAKARANETIIVQAKITIVTYDRQNIFIVQATGLFQHFKTRFHFFFRNVLGTKNLGDILSEREGIASMMQATLDEATDPWGVKVERVEV
jgi:regulator of protease activity HflC (stomatin/prohibitin superfamily)